MPTLPPWNKAEYVPVEEDCVAVHVFRVREIDIGGYHCFPILPYRKMEFGEVIERSPVKIFQGRYGTTLSMSRRPNRASSRIMRLSGFLPDNGARLYSFD